MSPENQQRLDLARSKAKENRKYFSKLRAKKPKNLDSVFHDLHEEVFEEVDCLECANCCKTTSPMFFDKDIERIARHLRMKPSEFVATYLKVDDEGDYVLQQAPCPFLGGDNYCSIYEVRPKACREYPHTDRKRMHQILPLTLKNTSVCPAVVEIVERMKQEFPQ